MMRNMLADLVGWLVNLFIRWQHRNDRPSGKHWANE